MKIFLIGRSINRSGGIEKYCVEMIDGLKQLGAEVSIFASAVRDINIKFIKAKEIDFLPQWINSILFALRATFFKFIGIDNKSVSLSNGTASFFSDVVIAHSVHGAAISLTNRRRAAMNPDTYTKIYNFFRWFHPQNVATLFIEWFSLKFGSKRIIAVSKKTRQEIISFYHINPEKIDVVYNGVNIEEYKKEENLRTETRKQLNVLDTDFIILFVGHEFKRKGLAQLIGAIAKTQNKNIKLVIIGKDSFDSYRDQAEKLGLNREQMIYLGKIDNGLNAYYNAADVFVLPTLDEPFGLVVTEAMAAGLPVVISEDAGVSEILEDGADSLFINPLSIESICTAIEKLVDDKEMRNALGERGAQTAKRFSWYVIAKQTFEILNNVNSKK